MTIIFYLIVADPLTKLLSSVIPLNLPFIESLKLGGFTLSLIVGVSGIVASFVLAISRAFGETMAVTLAAGATPQFTLNPLESIQTMTAYIVQVSLGDTPAGGIEYQTIFAVAALLFTVTLLMNLISNFIMNKYREEYD